jgi:hypothetical protein
MINERGGEAREWSVYSLQRRRALVLTCVVVPGRRRRLAIVADDNEDFRRKGTLKSIGASGTCMLFDDGDGVG